jgi:hypothetical protein
VRSLTIRQSPRLPTSVAAESVAEFVRIQIAAGLTWHGFSNEPNTGALRFSRQLKQVRGAGDSRWILRGDDALELRKPHCPRVDRLADASPDTRSAGPRRQPVP